MIADAVTVTKAAETETVIAGAFGVSRFELFDALTKPERLRQWLRAGQMAPVEVDSDHHHTRRLAAAQTGVGCQRNLQ